jgi:hypothetical protein
MKRTVVALALLSVLNSSTVSGQLTPVQQKAIVVKRMVEKNHYAPRVVNDSFSIAVFNMLLN